MSELKICVVSHSYPNFKGDWRANFVESLVEAYAKQANVVVYTPFTREWNRALLDQGPVGFESRVRIVHYRYAPLRSQHTMGEDSIMKGDLKLNLKYILFFPALLFFGTINLAWLLRKEKFDFVHAHWAVPNALIAIFAKWISFSKTRVLTSFPGSDVTVLKNSGAIGKIASWLIAKSDFLSCNSSDLKEDLVSLGLHAPRIDLVIYGVDKSKLRKSLERRHDVREELGFTDKQIVLLLVGRFVEKKGFSTAFQALKYLKEVAHVDFRLLVIGGGPLKAEYDQILAKDGTQSMVTFTGNVPLDKLSGYYSAADILLMPSKRFPSDGLNVVVPEAMACGLPVVATDVGGNDLVIFHGVNGFLHSEGDERQLADWVTKIAFDVNLRSQFGLEAVKLIETKFNWDVIARYYIDCYKKL